MVKMARFNISISSEIMNKVDKYKGFTKLTRSGFILKALENYFPEVETKIFEDKKREAVDGILKIREEIGPMLEGWDSTAEIKKLRDIRWAGNKKWQDTEK
jgi:metal-responsive CopG/Arc/MetJ family transcriptional regulator